MKTFALFHDGSVDEINISRYDPMHDQEKFLVSDPKGAARESPDIMKSAEVAFDAAIFVLQKMGCSTGRYYIHYQFKNETKGAKFVHGESAGLAFCLDFAAKIWENLSRPAKLNFAIAATGVINDDQGEVTRVDSITGKLQGALDVLQHGGRIFYPRDNDSEISTGIRDAASTKGIALIPVATVQEALAELFRIRQDEIASMENSAVKTLHGTSRLDGLSFFSRIPRPVILVSSIFLLLLLLAGYLFYPRCPDPVEVLPVLQNGLEWGRFQESRDKVRELMECVSQPDTRVAKMEREMTKPLDLKNEFEYLRTLGGPERLNPGEASKIVLRSGDGFRFHLAPAESCYLYVFQVDSGDNLAQIFPDPKHASPGNFLQAGVHYQIPPGRDDWFLLDEKTGTETIFITASAWPAKDLEELSQGLASVMPVKEKNEQKTKLLERIKARSAARTEGIGGVYYEESAFRHE